MYSADPIYDTFPTVTNMSTFCPPNALLLLKLAPFKIGQNTNGRKMFKRNVDVWNETMCIAKTSFQWLPIVHNSASDATSIYIYFLNKENCSDTSD